MKTEQDNTNPQDNTNTPTTQDQDQNPTTPAAQPSPPQGGKWTAGTPAPGPRQIKRINDLIRDIRWTGSTIRETSGVIGISESAHSYNIVYGGPGMTEYSRGLYHAAAGRFNWTVTRDNVRDIEAALEAVLKDISRPEVFHQVDTRITPEKDREDRAAAERRRIEREEAAKAEAERLHAAGELTDAEKSNYDIKTIAEITRRELQQKYPYCRFSVTIERYSGGQSLSVDLLSGPFDAIDRKHIEQEILEQEAGDAMEKGLSSAAVLESFKDQIDRSCQYHQCGHIRGEYTDGITNGRTQRLTKEAWEVMGAAQAITDRYNWDHSDPQTDYFDVHFYLHLNIGDGKNRRPFTRTDPATTAPAAQDAQSGATVRRNEAKGGVEVLFPSKPGPEVIAALKAAGFRWSFKTRVWYARYSEAMEVKARQIIGQA